MSNETHHDVELRAVAARYARRTDNARYSILNPEVILSTQECQREMLFMFRSACGFTAESMRQIRVVDVGCGFGGHLLNFLRFGVSPENLFGIELLPDRVAYARTRVPSAVVIHEGDASTADLPPASQDVVFQSVVFSSLLSDSFQEQLAERMWSWLRPGGGVLWYDFIYNNPNNADVRGVPLKRVRELFPNGEISTRRVTLAPPISRRVCRLHPAAYHLFNMIPWLRSHLLCWIQKTR